jgi:hypothetical protein
MTIANHSKLSLGIATILMDVATEVARKHIVFTRASLKLVLALLNRFSDNSYFVENLEMIISSYMKSIQTQDASKVSMYSRLKDKPKLYGNNDPRLQKAIKRQSRKGGQTYLDKVVQTLSPKTTKKFDPNPEAVLSIDLGVDGRLDDSMIAKCFDHRLYPEETTQYINFKTNEKMIVNLLQCIIHSGHSHLGTFIKAQVLSTFVKIEQKHKFRNKGLHYLLGLYGKDVEMLLK